MSMYIWTTHSLDKLFPESQPPPEKPQRINLKLARNEREDAQIALRIPKGNGRVHASFKVSGLAGPGGAIIPAGCVSAHWLWYTWVPRNPPASADPAMVLRMAPAFFPDAFLEQARIAVIEEWTQPLWITVSAPEGARPGEYKGKITMRVEPDKGGKAEEFDVQLTATVWPFTLPAKPGLRHTEWFFPELLAQYYRIEQWSKQHWQWIGRVAADMAAHRQDTFLTPITELVAVTRGAGGRFSYDFNRLDKWINIFLKAGLDLIEGGFVAHNAAGTPPSIKWRRFPVYKADGSRLDTDGLSDEEFTPHVKGLLKAVHAHIREKGWAGRYMQHVADEPAKGAHKSWKARATQVREWMPGVRILDAIWIPEVNEVLAGHVDVRVLNMSLLPCERAQGEEMWTYVCCGPQGHFPNRFLDYASRKNRIIFWLCRTMGLRGFLHWGYNHWRHIGPVEVDAAPWLDAMGGAVYGGDPIVIPAGDPFIVYPGRDRICSSLRWEVIRKGMEDYEYIRMLEDAIQKPRKGAAPETIARARALLERIRTEIAAGPLKYAANDEALLETREKMGELLSLISEGGRS